MKSNIRTKIALVAPDLWHTGGVNSVTEFLLRAIRRSGKYDVRLISLATAADDPASVLLRRPSSWRRGVTTLQGTLDGKTFTHIGAVAAELEFKRFSPSRLLRKLVEDCDLVQVVAGAPAWAVTTVGCAKPVVLQVATLAKVERVARARTSSGPLAYWRRWMSKITARYDERGLRAVDAIMVENQWMFDYASRAVGNSGALVRYAPPGVDVELFHPAEVPEARLAPPAYVLGIGRFADPRKNIGLLLDAFAGACELCRDPLRLIIATPDDPGAIFRNKIQSLGIENQVSVRLHVSNEELAKLYRNAMCFALSSEEEGFGVVVAEAMASGVPPVATRCGGPDGIIADGVDGFLVDKGDAATMAKRIATLAENKALNLEMGRRARQTALARFSEQVAGKAFLDVYDTLIARRSKSGEIG